MCISVTERHRTCCHHCFWEKASGESWNFFRDSVSFFPLKGTCQSWLSEARSQQFQIKIKKWGLRCKWAEHWTYHFLLAEFIPWVQGLPTALPKHLREKNSSGHWGDKGKPGWANMLSWEINDRDRTCDQLLGLSSRPALGTQACCCFLVINFKLFIEISMHSYKHCSLMVGI